MKLVAFLIAEFAAVTQENKLAGVSTRPIRPSSSAGPAAYRET
jgi:hypothetical protein